MPKLAVNGGKKLRETPFPSWPVFGEEERKRLLEVFESGKWFFGDRVREFQGQFAAFQGAKHGIATTNGTAALEAALVCCDIGAGDEVIIPAYTFIATASAVLSVNAIPVFADIDIETANIDPEDIKRKITGKTRAIVPVHFAGLPCDFDALNGIVKQHPLTLIEDACHSWGSKWKGKGTGAIGHCGVFSFQMGKAITSGEGGIVLTDNTELAESIQSYVDCGRMPGKPWYEHYVRATNMRMTEFQAAVLLGQLTRLESHTLTREENAIYLDGALKDVPGIRVLRSDARVTRRSYQLYVVQYIKEEWENIERDKFIEALNEEGIPCSGGYPYPLYKNPFFNEDDYAATSCPNAEQMCTEAIWIKHPVLLAEKQEIEDIVRAIVKIRENMVELL